MTFKPVYLIYKSLFFTTFTFYHQILLKVESIITEQGVVMPDESDVEGATQALVRIQFAYM